jgi:ribosomal protein S18 acetylase RimI-like enzyme
MAPDANGRSRLVTLEKTTFLIRDARAGERETIRALTEHAYAEYATIMDPTSWAGLSAALDRALQSEEPVDRIVAADSKTLIGSVMLYSPGVDAYGAGGPGLRWPEVRLLSVAPAARGRGVARALMDECVRRARVAGATDLGIHTSRSMRAAMRLYERMGFARAPEHDFHPPGAEVVEGYRLRLV